MCATMTKRYSLSSDFRQQCVNVPECSTTFTHYRDEETHVLMTGVILRPQNIGRTSSVGTWSDGEPETDLSLESSRARRSGMLIPEQSARHLLTSKTELIGRRPCRPSVMVYRTLVGTLDLRVVFSSVVGCSVKSARESYLQGPARARLD